LTSELQGIQASGVVCGFVAATLLNAAAAEPGKFLGVAGNVAESCCIVRVLFVTFEVGFSGAAALGRLKESGVVSVGRLVGADVTMTTAFLMETLRSAACKVAETRSFVIF